MSKEWSFDDFDPETDMAPPGSDEDCDGTGEFYEEDDDGDAG